MSPETSVNPFETLSKELMRDLRADKRKSFLFRILTWTYIVITTIATFGLFYGGSSSDIPGKEDPHVGVIDVFGPIQRKGGVAANPVIEALHNAFQNEHTTSVLLDMDSPGGSAVQSDLVYREIVRLRDKFPDKPVIAVVGDVCASGCYYIASAADEIVINRLSMIGSIGVRMDGFGFTGLMDKLGVERRILTAGENKIISDPYSTVRPEINAHLTEHVLLKTHNVFIDAVKTGRGERLHEDPALFSGLVWVGHEAIEKGLADRIGSVSSVARELAEEGNQVNYSIRQPRILDWFTGAAAAVKQELVNSDLRLSLL
ncbi:S49 family peptidase [Hydrocarboniclastica marina]|uniref:S49 family peptidase n=1 Tax=Hydrocarboniclastica marina TaxID=2259620 RepID=A0A4P7XMV7_9ALTE|nr:S49 family peptidase [Hydrocarboniclastica marina]QCF28124.1 S49 family peptidase [Hydrocarboniclastica marina]